MEAVGKYFLDAGFATELLRPLVDHTLSVAAASADVAGRCPFEVAVCCLLPAAALPAGLCSFIY